MNEARSWRSITILPAGARILMVEEPDRCMPGDDAGPRCRVRPPVTPATSPVVCPASWSSSRLASPRSPPSSPRSTASSRYGGIVKRGMRKVIVDPKDEDTGEDARVALAPAGRPPARARRATTSSAGDPLIEGPINPHDILERDQGARTRCRTTWSTRSRRSTDSRAWTINDKHIEVIVRQMLRKVQVEEVPATPASSSGRPDRRASEFHVGERSRSLRRQGGRAATYRPAAARDHQGLA